VVLRRAGRRCGSAAVDRGHPVLPRRRSNASARPVTDVVERPRSSCSSATTHPLAHWPGAAARRAHEHEEEEDGGHSRRRDRTPDGGERAAAAAMARGTGRPDGIKNGWSWPAMSSIDREGEGGAAGGRVAQ
jgi:hypothetical protein